jgi:hypothetical protein
MGFFASLVASAPTTQMVGMALLVKTALPGNTKTNQGVPLVWIVCLANTKTNRGKSSVLIAQRAAIPWI